MKRLEFVAAVVVILAAGGWALLSSGQNRREPRGGTLELTERELPFAWMPGESTVSLLEFRWDALGKGRDDFGGPVWLDAAKLADLGFDCSVLLTDPRAGAHYRSLPPRSVFVALEYEGPAWQQAPADRRKKTRLFAVDAARDPQTLLARHPDTGRQVIARGVVRLVFLNRDEPGAGGVSRPRLGGWLEAPMPQQVFLPAPFAGELAEFRSKGDQRSDEDRAESQPRYAVTLSWGTQYTPWVTAVRRLPP